MKKYLVWLLVMPLALLLVGCDQLTSQEGTNQKTVYVGPEKVDCEGEGPQSCYLIKETPEDQYTLWYDEIEGFEFEPGYEYELIVSENQVANPPAGGSSITWTLEEVVDKAAVAQVGSEETAEKPGTAESEPVAEEEALEEAPVQLEFVPISVDDMGLTTVAPAGWPKIKDDPLLKNAWGPGQFRFIAFHSVSGDDTQEAMAQLLNTTVGELKAGSIDGDYWEEEIGGHLWAMYAIENPGVGLVQSVSMTGQDGTIYIVSLFIESGQNDAILTPVLENFAITGQGEMADAEVLGDEGTNTLIGAQWHLTAYDDGNGQLVDVMPEVEITAVFAEDGRVSGSAGCNDYVSLYTVEGRNLNITLPAITRKECVDPPGVMIQETGYLGDLTAAAAYQINGIELQIHDEEDNVILTYLAS